MAAADARIMVFAKAPRPGAVKTRLIPLLGDEGAARLHAALVRHTLQTATAEDLYPVDLWCAPVTDDPFFRACAQEFNITLRTQRGADLGARMQHAFASALSTAARAVLIGTDCPALTPEILERTLQALHAEDAVFAPALDGGYVLIGLRQNDPALFEDIPWGTPEVMNATRERLRQLKRRWRETAALPDIDEADDLRFLPPEMQGNTA